MEQVTSLLHSMRTGAIMMTGVGLGKTGLGWTVGLAFLAAK